MRRLNKSQPLQSFADCVKDKKPANWDDFSLVYQNISQDARLHILCNEQDSLCGYTELPIEDPYDCHIDHYRKKSQFPQLTFDWQNFVVAVKDSDFGANHKDSKYKIRINEYALILNPVTTNVQDYFYYPDYDLGNILPKPGLSDDQKAIAEKTIEVFNLRHPSLKRKRGQVLQMMLDYGDLPTADIRDCLVNYGFKSLVEQYS